MRGTRYFSVLKKISAGIIASAIVLTGVFIYNRELLAEILIYESTPFASYKTVSFNKTPAEAEKTPEPLPIPIPTEPPETLSVFTADEAEIEYTTQVEEGFNADFSGEIVGLSQISYQPETSETESEENNAATVISPPITPILDDWRTDFSLLRKNFYTVASGTDMTEKDFNAEELVNADMKLVPGNEPKILIIHTHMYEGYANSDPDNIFDGVFGVGERLARTLADKYGISCLHNAERYDVVNGVIGVTDGAYERMEPSVIKILENHPTIEVVLDVHRDGIDDDKKLAATINGQPVAPIMFVNGLSKIKSGNTLTDIASLPNPFLKQNLAFSFQSQLAANELYPGFARRIYLNAWRYSLNMMGKSLLIEIGEQKNTKEEAFASAELLADVLARVLLP
ncbi:hypothetical protein FACS189490_07010 [Clostridia bacterium]|nr:hypothetical protein FACS189490_07010 [Clostridia bacterium]